MGFKGLTLNTPPEETAHIHAEDDAAIFQSIAGGDGVFAIGQQCKATTLSNNKIRIADGVVIIGGHFARIPYGEYEDCEIENGESGKKRNDIIVAVFETTGTGGIDKMHCIVKKGVAGSAAVDPELKQDDIYNNGKIRELPLYRVKIEGLSIVAVEQMFKLKSDMSTLNKRLSDTSYEIIKSSTGYVKKYANGMFEAWAKSSVKNSDFTFKQIRNTVLYYAQYRNFGFGIKATEVFNIQTSAMNNGVIWAARPSLNTSKEAVDGYVIQIGTQQEYVTYLDAYVVGRWK